MLNIDRIQVGTTTYYIMDPIARSSLSTKVDATDIYTTTQINNLLEAKANSADLGDLALLDTISYTSDLLINKPTLGTMASKDDAASDNKQYVRKNGAWSEVSIPTLEWGQISGTLSNQTDLANALSTKANIADLGTLASKNSVSYSTEVTDKPTLGTLSSKDDVSSDNKLYGRKNGTWSEIPPSDVPTWGGIQGTLSNQTDLQEALSTKANAADLGDLASKDTVSWTSDIDGIPSTFPPSTHTHSYTTLTDKPTLGSLAALNSISYTSSYLTNKPTLGSLADQDTVNWETEVTNKPTLGSLAAKDTVSWSTDITDIPSSFPPSSHTHDDRYYTESEVDAALSTKAPLASPAFTGTPTAPTATDGTNNTQIATTQFVHNAFKANDAMVFKGTIGSSGATVTSLPATHYKGWTYKVITAGTYAGQTCEIGDMIICVTDGTSATDSHWTVVQSNVDGAVTGPASATDTHVATFNGTSGKVIQDSGYTIGKSVPSDAVFTDTTYTNGDGITLSGTTFAANFPTSGTPAALGTASNGSATTVARSDHVHAKPSYGNINTSGAITSDTAVANGDKIVVTDSSNSSKLIRTGITFDGSTTTKALTPKGTWETFNNYSLPTASADTLGGVKVGTNLSIENGVLSATDTTYSQGAGISIDGTTINNSGVRNIATGGSNGTIKVNINGTSSDVAVKGLGSAAYSATTDFATTSHTHENSTTTTAGFMSAADKQKLNGIENNANNYSLPTASSSVLGGIKVGANLSINDGVLSATDTTYNNATSTTAGLMSSSDKNKLDGVESGANNYTLPTATSTTKGGIKIGNNLSMNGETLNAVDTTYTNGNGISLSGTTFSAAFPTSGTPADLGTASNGSSNNVARADHVHKKPTYTKSDVGLGNVTNDAQIPKSIGTSTGDLIYFTDDATPSKLSIGTDNQVLKAINGVPIWTSLSTYIEDAPDNNEYMRKNGEWIKPLLGQLAFMNSNGGIEIYMITK